MQNSVRPVRRVRCFFYVYGAWWGGVVLKTRLQATGNQVDVTLGFHQPLVNPCAVQKIVVPLQRKSDANAT